MESDERFDQRHTLRVGRDAAGHWLVQESGGRMEGRFVSFAAAMSFARAERFALHAAIEVASEPLTPIVPFRPTEAWETASRRIAA